MRANLKTRILSAIVLVGLLCSLIQPIIVSADTSASLRQALVSPQRPKSNPAPTALEDNSAKIEPLVSKELAAQGQADFFVWLAEKADLSPAYQLHSKEEKGQFVYNALRATAERSQSAIRSYLDTLGVEYQAYYIANKILVRDGGQSLLTTLAARPDVARITANHFYQLDEPRVNPKEIEEILVVEPNISFINADDAWALGITGQGVTLAGNDTGLDWQHPAIKNHYRGWDGVAANHNYNWWDATGTYPNAPGDGMGHGTHTTGTMVGDDGGANQIGVAPGSQTVHCKNMDNGGGGYDEWFVECFQWDLAPWDLNGANPRPDLAPDAINNSWGYWGGGYPDFAGEIAALQAAGILVEVSAGNEGPSCSTLRSPGDYGEVLTTGSVSHASGSLPGTLTYFSSRGPSSLSADYLPDIMAPGENIRSAVPGGGYQNWDGTSMAGPHVTGLIGLMWSANPGLRGMVAETQQIIFQTTVPLTGQTGSNCGGDYSTGPNNDWGYGSIDALTAVQAAMSFGGVGTLQGTVTEQSSGDPLEDVQIRAQLNPALAWTMTTDGAGHYARLVFSGTYTVTASLYGYYPAVETGVTVVEDLTTTLDLELQQAPFYTVSGQVTDAMAGWPLYARIDIAGYPYGPVWTDPVSGAYSVSLAAGIEYTFNVTAWVDGYQTAARTVGPLIGPETQDFALDPDLAACSAPGYQPELIYFEDFEANNGVYTTTGNTSFEWGAPTSGSRSAHSGQNVWATNLSGNYFDDENGSLESPDIDLSTALARATGGGGGGSGEITLIVSWWQYLQTEEGFDYAWVEVSNDGGASWTTVYGPVTGQVDTGWTKYSAYLDPSYAVSNFRIRFTLQSDFSITDDGFYIDDIGIGVVIPLPNLYAEDFDSGDGGYTTSGTTSWAWGIPTRGPNGAHSTPNAWGTNLTGNYSNDEDGYVTCPTIDLSAGSGEALLLSWWQWLQTESGYDFASVEVSDGLSWTVVYTTSGIINTDWTKNSLLLSDQYAVSDFQVRFRLVSDETVTYPGFYVDDISIDIYTGDPPMVPCNLQSGGLVVGIVYDANLNQGLVGANVSSSVDHTLTLPTPDDPALEDGFYTLFALAGPQDIMAYLTSNYGIDLQTPTVLLSDTIRQDLSLVAGYLTTDPDLLEITLDMGISDTLSFDLSNSGGMPTSYEIGERNRGFLPLARVTTFVSGDRSEEGNSRQAPGTYQPVLTLPATQSTASSDETACVFKDLDPWGVTDTEDLLAANSIPYVVYTSAEFGSLDFSECQMIVFSGDQPQGFYDAYGLYVDKFEDYVENGGFLNFFSADAGWNFGFLNTPLPGGMLWNPNYAETNEVVDPDHPVVQGVPNPFYGFYASHGGFSNLPEEAHIIAQDNSGLPTIVEYPFGSGWLIAFGQPLEISHNWGWDGGVILDNSLIWGHEFLPLNVPWLNTLPISGTLVGGMTDTITAYFDASVPEVNQPGAYMANLRVANDTPYGALLLPVTMNVNPPADWGKLVGTVTGLGRCDAPGEPLAGAEVAITGVATVKTDTSGSYGYWMAEGSYQVNITAPGYISQTFTAEVLAGQSNPYDIDLRLDAPCTDISQATVEITVPEGTLVSQTLTLGNLGAGELAFSFLESLMPLEAVSPPTLLPQRAMEYETTQPNGPTSVQTLNLPASRPESVEAPLSTWFGGLDLPGGLVRYAFAQCAEQPESYYVFSGVDANFGISAKSWRYDATTNDWTRLADIPAGSEAPAAACYQGKVYVMGGSGTDQLYIYNIATDGWSYGAPLPRLVEGPAAAAWGGKIYLIGGDDDFYPENGVAAEVNIYDIATDSWLENGASLPVATGNAGYAQIGPYVYVVGGWGEMSPSENVTVTQRYDITSDTWDLGPGFTSARADFALAATGQALYALGGDEDGRSFFDASDTAERLDLSIWPARAWSSLGDPLPLGLTSNNAGFCTQGLMNGGIAETWSVGGLDPNWNVSGRTLFRETSSDTCYSIYSDVPWLSETPISGSVPGDEQGEVAIGFDATTLTPGLYTATLAIFTDDPDASLLYLPVQLTVVDATYGVSLDPVSQSQSGWAGATLTYTLQVNNLGIVPDSYDVAVTGNNWEVTIPTMIGPVNPGEQAVLQVVVNLPQDALGGELDVVTITVTSQGDSTHSASATLISSVRGPYWVFLPLTYQNQP